MSPSARKEASVQDDVHLSQEAIDGFTWRDVYAMVLREVVTAVCTECGLECEVEPDAEGYTCHDGCGSENSITSPLRKLGWV